MDECRTKEDRSVPLILPNTDGRPSIDTREGRPSHIPRLTGSGALARPNIPEEELVRIGVGLEEGAIHRKVEVCDSLSVASEDSVAAVGRGGEDVNTRVLGANRKPVAVGRVLDGGNEVVGHLDLADQCDKDGE